MWRKPQTRQRLPAKAYFHCSERCTVGAPGRSGSGRRGGSRRSCPRQVRKVRVGQVVPPARPPARPPTGTPASARAACAAGSASVVRSTSASAPSASDSTTITCPGWARSSTSHSATAAWAAPRLPTDPERSGASDAVADAEPLGDGLDRPHVEPAHNGVVDVALGQPRIFQRGRKGLAGQRHVELLAEALLPDVRVRLAGDAPAVQELVARRAPADHLGHRAVGRADERGGAVTAVALLGRAGQAGAQVRDHRQRGATAARPTPHPAPGAARPRPSADEPVKS